MEEIVIFGHPSLRTKSSEITEFNNELEKLSERMIKIMYEAPGVGLAAPQIGINKNIFVFDAGDGPKTAINPTKIEVEGSAVFLEGCLSLPGYYWEIERPEFAKIYCQNLKGEPITYEGDELTGRVLQHEFDHLKGKLLLSSLTLGPNTKLVFSRESSVSESIL